MSLNPSDIESHRFREAFRGYDKDDVDEFLDRVADRMNELLIERERIEERLATIQADAAESVEAERLLKRTLITAQRTADETVAEAREEADRMRADAERHAAEVRDDAEQRAAAALDDAASRAAATLAEAEERGAERLSEAQERAASIMDDVERRATQDLEAAREQLQRVRSAVHDLERFRSEYRDRVRVVIAEQLEALDRIGEMPEVPAEMVAMGEEADAQAAQLERTGGPGPAGERWQPESGDQPEGSGTMPAPELPGLPSAGDQQLLERAGDDDGDEGQTRLLDDTDAHDRQITMMGRRAGWRRERTGRPAPEATEPDRPAPEATEPDRPAPEATQHEERA